MGSNLIINLAAAHRRGFAATKGYVDAAVGTLTRVTLNITGGPFDALSIGTASFIKIAGPGTTFVITGVAGGVDEKMIVIYNSTTHNMVIADTKLAGVGAGPEPDPHRDRRGGVHHRRGLGHHDLRRRATEVDRDVPPALTRVQAR